MPISYLAILFLASSSIPFVQASCDSSGCHSINVAVIPVALLVFVCIASCSFTHYRRRRQKRVRDSAISHVRNAQAQAALPTYNGNANVLNPAYTQQPSYNPPMAYGPPPRNSEPGPVRNPPPPAMDTPQYPPPSYTAV